MDNEMLEKIIILCELLFDEIESLYNRIGSSKSMVLNSLLEENYNLSANIYIQFSEMALLSKDITKLSYGRTLQFADRQIDAINSNIAEIKDLSLKINKDDIVNSEMLFTQREIALEIIKNSKSAVEVSYLATEINNLAISSSIYILLAGFYRALAINDYNKSKKLKENLESEIGNVIDTIPIVSEIKSIWNIITQTVKLFSELDKENLMDEFIENIGDGISKIEKQQELLTMVFYYNQTFIEELKKIINDESF